MSRTVTIEAKPRRTLIFERPDGRRLTVEKTSRNILLENKALRGEPGAGITPTNIEALIIETASQASISNITRDGDGIQLVTYADYKGVTNHTKTISRDGNGAAHIITEVFNYDGETWTITSTLGRNGSDQVISKATTIQRAEISIPTLVAANTADFDGTANSRLTGASQAFGVSDWSMSVRLKFTSSAYMECFRKTTNQSIIFGALGTDDKLFFQIGAQFITSSTAWNDGNWHNVLITYESSSGDMVMYVDGASDGTVTTTATGADLTGSIFIGSNGGGNSRWTGGIATVRTYDYLVSATDANTHTALAAAIPDSSLISNLSIGLINSWYLANGGDCMTAGQELTDNKGLNNLTNGGDVTFIDAGLELECL